jgi:hypothetical protein
MKGYLVVLALLILASFLGPAAWGEQHTGGVPVLNSRPEAPYTLYLDFAGFNFNGTWTWWWGPTQFTPGNTDAYNNAPATGTFTAVEQVSIQALWAGVAEKYAPFNINVTTVDPAPPTYTDAQRQAYYDSTPKMMHTVIGGDGSWTGQLLGGFSNTGATASAQSGGQHTNFVFSALAGATDRWVSETVAHEDGHGFGLYHQSDYDGSTLVNEYSVGTGTPATWLGSVAPIMGSGDLAQRGTWRTGDSDQMGTKATQNDVYVILNNNPGLTLVDDGIGHSRQTATVLPVTGGNGQANGWISPASSTNPEPIGSSNYTSDYFLFRSPGGSVTMTVEDVFLPSVPDTWPTLASTLQILDINGLVLYTAANNQGSFETITQVLPSGDYYAVISSYGGTTASYAGSPAYYYDMGPYWMYGTGLVPVPEPATLTLLALGGAVLATRRRKG